ncbi:MAG TPA: hypothetical protein VN366_03845 [Feifaniaceae bacterium]|nr:hypothetical protein [Feifaniaceae bacterium]
MSHQEKIDELLYGVAREQTKALPLDDVLSSIYRRAEREKQAERERRIHALRLKRVLIPAAAACAAALAACFLVRPVVVEGKTYVAWNGAVQIDGVTHRVDAPAEKTALKRLFDTNQYVITDDPSPTGAIMVFAPDTKEQEIKKETEPARRQEAVSIEPVAVYPAIGDLVVREGPDTAYAELAELFSGQCVKKVGMYGNWAIIEWNGALAYAFDAYLFEAPEEIPAYAPVTRYATEPVNIRALPTSREESAVLYELKINEPVSCTGVIGEWTQIEWGDGNGYVFTKYLKNRIS